MKVEGVSVRKISFRWQVSQAEGRRVRERCRTLHCQLSQMLESGREGWELER